MEFHYTNSAMPYNSIGSFMDFFGAMTYDHVNYIFADASYAPVSYLISFILQFLPIDYSLSGLAPLQE